MRHVYARSLAVADMIRRMGGDRNPRVAAMWRNIQVAPLFFPEFFRRTGCSGCGALTAAPVVFIILAARSPTNRWSDSHDQERRDRMRPRGFDFHGGACLRPETSRVRARAHDHFP